MMYCGLIFILFHLSYAFNRPLKSLKGNKISTIVNNNVHNGLILHASSNRKNVVSTKNDLINNDKTSQNFTPPPWLPSFLTAAAGGALFGSDIGSSSTVVRILGSGNTDLGVLDSIQLGQIASISLLGAMIASGSLIVIGDSKIGRKTELLSASLLYLLGTIVQSSSTTFDIVILGRIIYGLGIGTAMHVAPLYIAETAPDDKRGGLVSLKEAFIVLGIVGGYGAGAIFGNTANPNDWQSVFQCSLPIEIFMIGGALSVSESPRWLALRQRKQEAVDALMNIQGLDVKEANRVVDSMTTQTMNNAKSINKNSDSVKSSQKNIKNGNRFSLRSIKTPTVKPSTNTNDIAEIATINKSDDEDNFVNKLSEIFTSDVNQQALIIGVGLVVLQQLSGQPSVLYYANRIFEDAGLGFEAALGVGVFKLVMTIISASLVENPNFGRKKLLLYGNAGVTASLTTLASLYYFSDGEPNTNFVIAAILAFVGFYQVGFGPLTWLILAEIFPLRVRSAAVSIGTLANFACNLLVALLFEVERKTLGESLLFAQFAVVAAIATVFTATFVFETRGLSLEEIEEKLKNRVNDSKSS